MKAAYRWCLAHPLVIAAVALVLNIVVGPDVTNDGIAIWWCARRGSFERRLVRGLLVAAFFVGADALLQRNWGIAVAAHLFWRILAAFGFAVSAEYLEKPLARLFAGIWFSPAEGVENRLQSPASVLDPEPLGRAYSAVYSPVMSALYVMAADASGLNFGLPLRLYALWRASRRRTFIDRMLAVVGTALLLFIVDYFVIGTDLRGVLDINEFHSMIHRWVREYSVLVGFALGSELVSPKSRFSRAFTGCLASIILFWMLYHLGPSFSSSTAFLIWFFAVVWSSSKGSYQHRVLSSLITTSLLWIVFITYLYYTSGAGSVVLRENATVLLETLVGLLLCAVFVATVNRWRATGDRQPGLEKESEKYSSDDHETLRPEKDDSPAANDAATIISIHGTFAADRLDVGRFWWQQTSSFQRDLEEALVRRSVSLNPLRQTFHWSGNNLESSRFAAGRSLLQLLLRLENASQPYHLVCHSHGGGVAWEALKQSVATHPDNSGNECNYKVHTLPCMKSWTTVGTPFIRQSVASVRRGRAILAGIFRTLFIVGGAILVVVSAVQGWLVNRSLLISIPVIIVWPSIAVLCLGALMYVSMKEQARADQVEDQRLADRAADLYRDRWFGVWSSNDEAINGLQASIAFTGPVVPRLKSPTLIFKTQVAVSREIEPVAKLWRFCFNRFIAPVLDSVTWSTLARNVQGNDRPAMRVGSIETSPHSTMISTALPAEVSKSIERVADQKASRVIPQIRLALGQAATGQGIGIIMQHADVATALVHTSYFDVADVIDVIAHHIATFHGYTDDSEISRELLSWYQEQSARSTRTKYEAGLNPPDANFPPSPDT